jgi:DNA-binding NtrC family response regulator
MPTNRTNHITVLFVSPLDEDHSSLQSIIGHSKWHLFAAKHLRAASAILQQHEVSVVLCERDLAPGKWTDVLDTIKDRPHPPSLIVTSRMADDRLWAEALNLGAWDVLAKPFERSEVLRSVKNAWQHWYNWQHQLFSVPARAMSAAT